MVVKLLSGAFGEEITGIDLRDTSDGKINLWFQTWKLNVLI